MWLRGWSPSRDRWRTMPEIETHGDAERPEPQQPHGESAPNARFQATPALSAEETAGRDLPATLLGRYQVMEVVGRGAFAIVYRANQVGVGRIVALKVFRLHKSARGDAKSAEAALLRFQREARLASSLRHPNTITLYDYDKTDTGVLYMAFEFIDGPTLAEEIKANPEGISPARVIHIARQIAASLEEAHEKGIVHRDMKPGNIMLTRDRKDPDFTKVLDFGIAKLLEDSEEDPEWAADRTDALRVVDVGNPKPEGGDLTGDGKIVGTPRYVPPEQIQGGEVKPAADIYSLGLIMHELLSGVSANPGKTPQEMVEWHLQDRPFRARPGYDPPQGLAAIIRKATRREAAQRYASCTELLADLSRLDNDGEWLQEERKRPILAWILAANAVVLLVAALAVWFFLLRDPNPEAIATPPASAPSAPPASATPDPPTSAEAPPASAEAPPASAAAAAPAPVGPVSLQLTTDPPAVRVYLGAQRIGVTPFTYTVPADAQEVELTFRKNGYEDRAVTWRREHADAFATPITLDRRGAAPAARPPASGGSAPPASAPPAGNGGEKDNKYYILQ